MDIKKTIENIDLRKKILFEKEANTKLCIKCGSEEKLSAIMDENKHLIVFYGHPNISVGCLLVDSSNNKYCAQNIDGKKDFLLKNSVSIPATTIAYSPWDESHSLARLLQQNTQVNNTTNITITGSQITGDIGNFSFSQQMSSSEYWKRIDGEIGELYDSKKYEKILKQTSDEVDLGVKKLSTEESLKELAKKIGGSIRNFIFDFLAKYAAEMTRPG